MKTPDECVNAVTDLGFSPPQAQFLVHVLRHAGVCFVRQYRAFVQVAQGQQVHDFFRALVDRKLAVACPCPDRRGCFYHVHGTPLYRAIGGPDHPHRRVGSLGRAVERLMRLDVILQTPEIVWLATAGERRAALARIARPGNNDGFCAASGLEWPPLWTPGRLAIGVNANDTTVFVYVVTTHRTAPFRNFLQDHAQVLRALPTWTVRLLIPSHLRATEPLYRAAFETEFARLKRDICDALGAPLRVSMTDALSSLTCDLLASRYHGLDHLVGTA